MPKTTSTSSPLAVLEEVIPNVKENQVKKSIKRKKYLCVVNIFMKKSIGATTIKKCILDLEINFIVGKLLVSVPGMKKQLIKTIFENEIV